MTALRFFKGALSQDITLAAGMIWFDTAKNVIKVYNGSAWEEYCGNIQVKDVKFENNVLTITPREGNATTLDFSDVASAKQTMAVFASLEKSIADLQTADSNTNTRIDELTAGMPDGQKTIVSYVAAEIAKADKTSAIAGVAEDLAEEVKRATEKEAELAKTIEDNATAAAEALADAVGEYAAEGVEASGLRKEIAERDAAVLAEAKEYVDGFVGENGTLEKRVADLEAIDHAKVAKDAADAAQAAAEATAKKYTDDELAEAIGVYAEGENPATGLRGEIAGVDGKVDALDGRVADVEAAITGEGGLDSRLDVLEGYFDGNTEGGVAGIVDAKIGELDADVTSAEGTKVRVQVVETDGKITGVTVTEDFSAITGAIEDEADRAAEEEGKLADAIAAEKARIDTLIGVTADSEGDKGMSVRAIAIEEVAKIVNETDNDSIDTLKEIAAWIAAHPKDVAAMNEAIQKNAGDIKTLNDEVIANEETVAAALTDLDTRVDALEAKNATIDSALQQADIVTGSTNGTISVKGSEVAVAGLQDAAYVTVESLNTTAQGYATTAKGEAVAAVVGDAANDTKDSKTIEGVKKYVNDKVANKNVEAAGDDYVSATAEGNKVTVATNMTAIREAVLTWESFN
jgi:hypothetical protein